MGLRAGIGGEEMSELELDENGLDQYGNDPNDDVLVNCCFPDCGCGGARLCTAKKGANNTSHVLNRERRSFVGFDQHEGKKK